MCKNVGDVSYLVSCFDLIRKTCLRCGSVGRHGATGVRVSNGTEITDLSAFRFSLCL